MENTTFGNTFAHFSLTITTFCILIDIVELDKLYGFGCYGNRFGGKMCHSFVIKMCVLIKWPGEASIARVLNHISLERAGHQHCNKVCGVCITSLGVELSIKVCIAYDNLCEYYRILVHSVLNIGAIQI